MHISLKAEKVFSIGSVNVTNSMLYGFVCALLLGWIMIVSAKRIHIRPQKGTFIGIIELVVEYVTKMLEGPLGERERAARFVPIFGFYFIFIMFNNLLGLLPIVGPGIYSASEGLHVPIFRPFTADLNGTIVMAVTAIVIVQYLSIKEQGFKKHIQHYFSDKPANPLNFFIGVLEVFGELTRILSLSLRLFLNTAVGEILISVFTSMILASGRTPIAVIPILLFEMLVAYIQAYVFMVLAATYLGLATGHHDSTDDHHSAAKLTNRLAEDGKG